MSVKKHCGVKTVGTHDGTFHCDEVRSSVKNGNIIAIIIESIHMPNSVILEAKRGFDTCIPEMRTPQ